MKTDKKSSRWSSGWTKPPAAVKDFTVTGFSDRLLQIYYHFSGFHSFLIGLFPFFLPVYLWKVGKEVNEITYFIGLTGLGFCIALWALDRLRICLSLKWLLSLSFVVELLLLFCVHFVELPTFFVFLGFINGAYSCFFVVLQRILFLGSVSPEVSWERFGNIQIYGAIVLKISVLLGGVLLDYQGNQAVWALSLIIAGLAVANFLFIQLIETEHGFQQGSPIELSEVGSFRDLFCSKFIFSIDGIFLVFESYLWLISLFLIVRESFSFLGVLVFILAALFSVFFIVIKNTIEHLSCQMVYVWAVLLYSGGWLLRATVSEQDNISLLTAKLIAITFFTSFFRLAFHKRFLDLAKQTLSFRYIFFKSYYSQLFLALVFIPVAFLLPTDVEIVGLLKDAYWIAGVMSVSYIFFRVPKYNLAGS